MNPWSPPPTAVMLGDDEVHVWRASLDVTVSQLRCLRDALVPEELERAERYHFEEGRKRFIAARGLLRVILGRYLGVEPSRLRFSHGPHGKPELAPETRETVRFNLSHSHRLALYAVTRGRRIGVDIERVRPQLTDGALAERCFSPREVVTLRGLPRHVQQEAFFNCWTRKEAYIKARGEGLSVPLDQFDVSLAPGEPAELLTTKGDPEEASRWSLRTLPCGAQYVAALAVEGHHWRLKCWQTPEDLKGS